MQAATANPLAGLDKVKDDMLKIINDAKQNQVLSFVMGDGESDTSQSIADSLSSDPKVKKLITALERDQLAKAKTNPSDLVTVISGLVDARLARELDLNHQKVKQRLQTEVTALHDNINTIATSIDGVKDAIRASHSRANSKAQRQREKARETWENDRKFLMDIAADINHNENDRKMIDEAMRKLRNTQGYSILNESDDVKALSDKMKIVESAHKALTLRIKQHFSKGARSSTKDQSDGPELKVPADLAQNKGGAFGDAVLTFMSGRITEYYLMYAFARRIIDDFNVNDGSHWLPRTCDIPESLKDFFDEQNAALYDEIMHKVTPAVKDRIHNTYTYGVDPKRKGRVEEHDGIMAIHAIMSCFKQTDTLYRNDVRDIIYSSYPKFGQGDPRSVIKLLRKKFAEANEVCEPINWEMFGAKVVTVLTQRDNTFSQNLGKYGPNGEAYQAHTNKNDSASLVDQLFADIELSCEQIEAAQIGQKNPRHVWHVNAITIKDKFIRNEWNTKVLDGRSKKDDRKQKSGSSRMNVTSMRCEALGCENNVKQEWQLVCDTCHKKSFTESIKLIGRNRFYPDAKSSAPKRNLKRKAERDAEAPHAKRNKDKLTKETVSAMIAEAVQTATASKATKREREEGEIIEIDDIAPTKSKKRRTVASAEATEIEEEDPNDILARLGLSDTEGYTEE